MNQNKNFFIEYLKNECVLVIALLLAIITSFISAPKIEYIDFKVLILLFNLMIVVSAFKELKVMDYIAISLLKKCNNYTSISFSLIFITFISSMFVTNDVALITFVPLSIIIARKANINILKIIVFQTLAANLGSCLTPMGNPQNLFIYSFYNISPLEFFKITGLVVLLSILFLSFLILKDKKLSLKLKLENIKIEDKTNVVLFSILFLIILLSVFHVIDYRLAFIITISMTIILNKNLIKKVDYSLLLTFIGFFIFVGNISSMDSVTNFMHGILDTGKSTYFSSILLSQIISNVPATMLISGFTSYYKELLLGVNIGGMGTLIASMASVISYKIYIKEFEGKGGEFLKFFSIYNILGLFIFVPLVYFFI